MKKFFFCGIDTFCFVLCCKTDEKCIVVIAINITFALCNLRLYSMKYISLSDGKTRNLPFYLAMEEYVASCFDFSEAFFMWQVAPTVIFGRNQLIEKEVNLNYCREHDIEMYRRKSGGGCVYADSGNIMFSYITKNYNVADSYSQYLDKVIVALNSIGVKADATGRNDILVDGKKIAGNAFYHVNGKSIVHGTMLYDTDMENMINAITPTTAKLQSKSVDSVRSRITTLKNYLNITINDFKREIKKQMCDDEVILNEEDIQEIEKIELIYHTASFIYGKNPHCNIEKEERLEGVGDFKVLIETYNGNILKINLMGDFFLLSEIDENLLDRLKNVPYKESAIKNVLSDINVGDIILNMTNEQFIKLIII